MIALCILKYAHDFTEKKKKPNKRHLKYYSTELSLMETMLSSLHPR